jgi:hypothetical protein
VGNVVAGENNYTWSNTSNAGGSTGEIGGKFIRNNAESYYADTNLSQTFNLNNIITGSGRFNFGGEHSTNGEWFIGHLSSNSSGDRSMLGLEFLENTSSSVRIRAKVGSPDGANDSAAFPTLTVNDGTYNFTYTYDPDYPGTSYGRITIRVYNDALSYDQTNYINLSSGTRSSGATFDAFGIGITAEVANSKDANAYINMWVDNLNYTGYQKIYAVDTFSSGTDSGGTGWGGNWSRSASHATMTGGALQLTSNDGTATRAVSLSGVTDARLSFQWKASGLEAGEKGVAEIYDGTSWIQVAELADPNDDNIFHSVVVSLAQYNLGSSFQVRFRSLASDTSDVITIEDLRIAL